MTQRREDSAKTYGKQANEYLTDMTKVQFAMVARVCLGKTEHSLWHGKRPDGVDVVIASLNRPKGRPAYDRGFACTNEAMEFFARATGNYQ